MIQDHIYIYIIYYAGYSRHILHNKYICILKFHILESILFVYTFFCPFWAFPSILCGLWAVISGFHPYIYKPTHFHMFFDPPSYQQTCQCPYFFGYLGRNFHLRYGLPSLSWYFQSTAPKYFR